MKIIKNVCFLVGVSFLFSSCISKQEKMIQTKMDEVRGKWKIDSFESISATPNQWKGFVKSGVFVFKTCQAKNVREERARCGADVELNGEIYSLLYRFDTYFIFNLNPATTDGSGMGIYTPNDYLVMSLIAGNWELTVSNNTMTGRQITSANPGVLSVFTATRSK
ncbi:MAG: hypothetical protein EAZ46_09290 [Runella sp.]|nr:MAG: hypothetical protein EAZ46_09290 [Runella sp.]